MNDRVAALAWAPIVAGFLTVAALTLALASLVYAVACVVELVRVGVRRARARWLAWLLTAEMG